MSNAWVTCPIEGDNSWKRLLIPHKKELPHGSFLKDLSLWDGPASDELVGKVTAYQGDDQ